MDRLLLKPEHSLIDQSAHPQHTIASVNGDGFGLGWYGDIRCPGLYRDTQPAWHDENLRHLAAHISSRLFFAHVRASSGPEIQRTNCHPFQYDNWLFQHNGRIGGFPRLKRALDQAVAPELYPEIRGSTDSERMFFLALTFGLREDPPAALRRMVGFVEATRSEAGIEDSTQITLSVSDGERLFALRYSSKRQSPTLYHSLNVRALRDICGRSEEVPPEGVTVLSEPLDSLSEHWAEVPESTLLTITNRQIERASFEPKYP